MLWIKDLSSPPADGFQYPSISGPNQRSFVFHNLCILVNQHYTANGHPVPSKEDVLKWVCDNQQVECFEDRKPYPNQFTNPPSYVSRGLKGPDWPLLLRPLKLLAQDGDNGLGDIVHRIIGAANSDAYKKWYRATFGVDCGCSARQDSLNASYPL